MEDIVRFKQGAGSPDAAILEAREEFAPEFRAVRGKYEIAIKVSREEADVDVTAALYTVIDTWPLADADRRASLQRWVRSFLWKRAIDIARHVHTDTRYRRVETVSLDDGTLDLPVRDTPDFPTLDVQSIRRRLPGGAVSMLFSSLVNPPRRDFGMTQAISFVTESNPYFSRKMIRHAARTLREKMTDIIETDYPALRR